MKKKAASRERTSKPKTAAGSDKEFVWTRKHLLGLEDLTPEELKHIFRTAEGFHDISTRSIKKVPPLRGRVVVNLFFENSTRTRIGLASALAK